MIECRLHRCLDIEAGIARISAGISTVMGMKDECLTEMELMVKLEAFWMELVFLCST